MSLTNCTDCGQRVSASATLCPHCGHEIDQAATGTSEQTDPQRAIVEASDSAAKASPESSGEASGFQLPTWLLFALVFIGGSLVLVAGVVAAGIVFTSIVGEWDGFGADDGTAAVGTTVTTVLTNGEAGLQIGQCLDEDELDKYLDGDDFVLVSCDEPHDTEVYFRHDFVPGPYPGDETVIDELKAVCRDVFEGYVGVDYESSALSFWALWPTQGAWEAGNLLGECALFDPDSNKLTGSAYQSGW